MEFVSQVSVGLLSDTDCQVHTSPNPSSTASLQHPIISLRASCGEYWKLVLSKEYLTSAVSRRTSWRSLLPIIGCASWPTLYMYHLLAVPRDVALAVAVLFTVSFLVASRLNTSNLWPDFIVVMAWMIAQMALLTTMPHSVYHSQLWGLHVLPLCIFTLAGLGVHSLLVGLFVVGMSAFVVLSPQTTRDEAICIPFTFVLLEIVIIPGEYCFVSLFAKLQTQLETTQRLLDVATNGFFTMDLQSQIMTRVSPQMSDTFSCNALVGARLEEFVKDSDRERLNSHIGRHDLDEVDLSPVLVTCYRTNVSGLHTGVFDAQVSPYALSHGELHCFVKVIGEIRDLLKPEALKDHSTSKSDDSLKSDDSDKMALWESASQVGPLAKGLSSKGKHRTQEAGSEISSFLLSEGPTSLAFSASVVARQVSSASVTDAGVQTDINFHDILVPADLKSASDFRLDRGSQVAAEVAAARPPKIPDSPLREDKVRKRSRSASPGHGNSSKSSLNADPVALQDEAPLLSGFKKTPMKELRNTVLDMIQRWNPPRLRACCCPKHGALRVLKAVGAKCLSDSCDALWSPYSGWQCGLCSGMNEEDDDMCGVCFSDQRCAVYRCTGEQDADSSGKES